MNLTRAGRLAYLIIPHLPVAVERRERPRLAGQPLVVAGAGPGTNTTVLDCSGEAAQEGVQPGMGLARAERLCPEAIFLPPRLDLYRAVAMHLFDLLRSQVPAVEQAQPGGLYLGLDGLEGRDAEALVLCRQQGEAVLQELGLAATAGIAGDKFSAEVASLCIGPNRALVLTSGTERDFLGDFPVELLPVDREMQRRLRLFGLLRLGQFARLPPAAVLAQFGWAGHRAQRLARGQDDRPLIPGRSERSETASREFDPPLDNLETLVAAAGRQVDGLARRLAAEFLRAGQVDVRVACIDGQQQVSRRILAEPTADAARLARLAEALLRPLAYSDRVGELTLVLGELSAPSLHQLSLWHDPQQEAAEAQLARLASRYGEDCFRHGVLVDPDHRLAGRRFVMSG